MALRDTLGSLFKQIVIGVAINIGISALTADHKEPDQGEPKPPESDPDKYLPVFWGTCRLGVNMFREMRVRPIPITQTSSFLGIKYSKQTVGYQYKLTAAGWLSHGPLRGIQDVIINGKKFASRLGQSSVQVEGVPITDTDFYGNPISVRQYSTVTQNAFGGAILFNPLEKYVDGWLVDVFAMTVLGPDAGGVWGGFRVYPGDGAANTMILPVASVTPPALLDPANPEPGYPEWAYVVFDDIYMGNSPNLPSIEFVGSRATHSLDGGPEFIPWTSNPFGILPPPLLTNSGSDMGDANPAGILYDILTDRKIGRGIPRAFVDETSFLAAWTDLKNEGFGLSHMIDERRPAEDDINDICRHIDAVIYFDLSDGLYKIRLLRAYQGDANDLPLLDGSVLLSCEYSETAQNQAINEVRVEFTNAYRNLTRDVVKVQNLASIQKAQEVNSVTVQYMSITQPTLAVLVAQRDLRVQSSAIGRGKFVGDRSLIARTPGELVRITWPEIGLFNKVVRIGEIDYGSLQDGKISCTFVEDYWSLAQASYETNDPATPAGPGQSFVVPTVQVEVLIDTVNSITYNLLITDPSNAVTDVAYAEIVGTNPLSAWVSDTDGVYTYEMFKNPVYSTRAFYRVTYTDQYGDPQEIIGEFPQPITTIAALPPPTLTYVFSGTDVVVIALAPVGANEVKFASALNTPPTTTDVQGGTSDTSVPYTYTTPAPTGTDLLYVGALATDGTLESGVARLTIAPQPVQPTTTPTIQYPFGNGAVMATAGDWLATSTGWDCTALRWKVRALKADRTQANIDATFSVKKVLEAGGSLVDMVGGTLSISGASEANGVCTGWIDASILQNDEIIVTLETMTNTNAVTSLLFTLTVEKPL